jgi:hypothetical protein
MGVGPSPEDLKRERLRAFSRSIVPADLLSPSRLTPTPYCVSSVRLAPPPSTAAAAAVARAEAQAQAHVAAAVQPLPALEAWPLVGQLTPSRVRMLAAQRRTYTTSPGDFADAAGWVQALRWEDAVARAVLRGAASPHDEAHMALQQQRLRPAAGVLHRGGASSPAGPSSLAAAASPSPAPLGVVAPSLLLSSAAPAAADTNGPPPQSLGAFLLEPTPVATPAVLPLGGAPRTPSHVPNDKHPLASGPAHTAEAPDALAAAAAAHRDASESHQYQLRCQPLGADASAVEQSSRRCTVRTTPDPHDALARIRRRLAVTPLLGRRDPGAAVASGATAPAGDVLAENRRHLAAAEAAFARFAVHGPALSPPALVTSPQARGTNAGDTGGVSAVREAIAALRERHQDGVATATQQQQGQQLRVVGRSASRTRGVATTLTPVAYAVR